MSSDSGDRRLALVGPPPEHERQFPCPRCDSTNTKFCYYNNYNLAQPRHFCKSCRRYWTQGGTLRNIPVGGGTRKTTKRSRTSSSVSHYDDPMPVNSISSRPITPVPAPVPVASLPMLIRSDMMNLNGFNNASGGGHGGGSGGVGGGFTSLLGAHGNGFLTLNGFGLGMGSGFDDLGFDIGRGVWPMGFAEVGEATTHSGGAVGGGVGSDLNTWQIGMGGDEGFGENQGCFTWPDLGISTPRKEVK